ncbi:MAG: hypothetical protein OHK0029_04120 [Armatimonadaceae bacterium]
MDTESAIMRQVMADAGMQETLMREALAEARRGMEDGEVPIGAVIALLEGDSPRIVARGYNRVNALQRKTAHAEIVAFENAGAGEDGEPSLPLDARNALLVSSLEPCVMCLGAAMEAGIAAVLFGLPAPADSGTGRMRAPDSPESAAPEVQGKILATESRELFREWLNRHEFDASREQRQFVEQLLQRTEEFSAAT